MVLNTLKISFCDRSISLVMLIKFLENIYINITHNGEISDLKAINTAINDLNDLPGGEINCDQEGKFSRARLSLCTPGELTSAISSNVGNSAA